MCGRTTPMIDVSMITTNWAAAIKPSAHHRRLLNFVGGAVVATSVSLAGCRSAWHKVDVSHVVPLSCVMRPTDVDDSGTTAPLFSGAQPRNHWTYPGIS